MWIQIVLGVLCWLAPALEPELVQQTFADNTRIEFESSTAADGTRVRHGDYRFYAADGTQRIIGEFEQGQRSGRWTFSTAEGKTWAIGKYSKGQRHGTWSIKGEGQTVLAQGKYKWGAPTGKWVLLDDQGAQRTGVFEQVTSEYEEGAIASEGTLFDGIKHGRWTFYWKNGRKQLEAEYYDGARTGPWQFWHSDGTQDPQMLRANHGERWAVTREFYESPILEPQDAALAMSPPSAPDPAQLEALDISAALRADATAHETLRFELAKLVEDLRARDYSQPEAWPAAHQHLIEAAGPFLRGHRLLPASSVPGPQTTGLAIARLHSLYQLTTHSPDFWLIDVNHTGHGEESETCTRLLHPPFLRDGLQDTQNQSGIYGLRFQRSKRDLRAKGGAGTEQALELALQWMVENQGEDGAWLADDPYYSAGVTGLVLLALMADGNTLREGPYQTSVRRGVSFLLERPHPSIKWQPNLNRRKLGKSLIPPDVSWVNSTNFLYTQAIVTQVYCELAAISPSPLIREVAQANADLCSKYRNPSAVWGYVMPGEGLDDTSVTCWMVAALLAAERAGLEVDTAYRAHSLTWFEEVTELMFGRAGYRSKDQSSSREMGVNEDYPRELTEALTAAALWTRFTLDQDPQELDVMVRSADTLTRCLPEWDAEKGYSNDLYYWYYGTYAMARSGGAHHKMWNKAIKEVLLTNQETIREERGSLENNGPWGSVGGRAYSTALLAMCLESYFRYDLSIR